MTLQLLVAMVPHTQELEGVTVMVVEVNGK